MSAAVSDPSGLGTWSKAPESTPRGTAAPLTTMSVHSGGEGALFS